MVKETKWQVAYRTFFMVCLLALLAAVLVMFTVASFATPDVCADAVGGQCIP